MHDFHYRNNELYCEQVAVRSIAKKVGTPFYLYSHHTLIDHFQKIQKAFEPVNPLICFAMKANGNLSIIRALVNQGAGVDVVSGGELKKAIHAGADPKKICFASVGKTEEEITLALTHDIFLFNVESIAELKVLDQIAKKTQKNPSVALRLNPDVDAVTHKSITTGTLKNKFGIDLKTARQIFLDHKKFPHVKIHGVHVHIGSQITQSEPFVKAMTKILSFMDALRNDGMMIDYLDIGGGMGIDYVKGTAQSAKDLAANLLPLLKKVNAKIIMEPGRFIVGNAGIFVTKALYLKDNGFKKFLIVDGGMNDLIRPTLYGAHHDIVPVVKRSSKKIKVDIVGPICESGDFFGKDFLLPLVNPGELIAVMSAGAYGFAMASNYNVRPRVAEVIVDKRSFAIIKQRETFADLIRGETIAGFLQ